MAGPMDIGELMDIANFAKASIEHEVQQFHDVVMKDFNRPARFDHAVEKFQRPLRPQKYVAFSPFPFRLHSVTLSAIPATNFCYPPGFPARNPAACGNRHRRSRQSRPRRFK